MTEKTLQEQEESDKTLGGIAEQINVLIPQGAKSERKIGNQCVGSEIAASSQIRMRLC
jgi:hypothetical protein